MRPKQIVVALLLVVVSIGCASTPSNTQVSSMIDHDLATHALERDEHLKLGRFSLSMVRGVCRIVGADLDENELNIVKSLRSVEISTYSIEPPLAQGQEFPLARVEKSLTEKGWSRMISTHEDGDELMLMTRSDDKGKIKGVFVLSADRHEVELVQIAGPLDKAFANAIAADRDLVSGMLGS